MPDSIWIRPRPSLAPGAFLIPARHHRSTISVTASGDAMSFAARQMSFVPPFIRA
jgi:hypothetical protein